MKITDIVEEYLSLLMALISLAVPFLIGVVLGWFLLIAAIKMLVKFAG